MAASAAARKRLQQHQEFVAAFDAWVAMSRTGTPGEQDRARLALAEARNRLGNVERLNAAARL